MNKRNNTFHNLIHIRFVQWRNSRFFVVTVFRSLETTTFYSTSNLPLLERSIWQSNRRKAQRKQNKLRSINSAQLSLPHGRIRLLRRRVRRFTLTRKVNVLPSTCIIIRFGFKAKVPPTNQSTCVKHFSFSNLGADATLTQMHFSPSTDWFNLKKFQFDLHFGTSFRLESSLYVFLCPILHSIFPVKRSSVITNFNETNARERNVQSNLANDLSANVRLMRSIAASQSWWFPQFTLLVIVWH